MTNLKLVKTKLMTDKFGKEEHKVTRDHQTLDCVEIVSRESCDTQLAVALKIKGLMIKASGSHIVAKSSRTSDTHSSILNLFYNSFVRFYEVKDSEFSQTPKLEPYAEDTVGYLLDVYFKKEEQNEDESTSCQIESLHCQAEELACECLSGSLQLTYSTSPQSSIRLENIFGITSSTILQTLNPEKYMLFHELRKDGLFEVIMQKLVEKELREFNTETDSLFELITQRSTRSISPVLSLEKDQFLKMVDMESTVLQDSAGEMGTEVEDRKHLIKFYSYLKHLITIKDLESKTSRSHEKEASESDSFGSLAPNLVLRKVDSYLQYTDDSDLPLPVMCSEVL